MVKLKTIQLLNKRQFARKKGISESTLHRHLKKGLYRLYKTPNKGVKSLFLHPDDAQ